jgi:hypothetical protein
MVRTYGQTPAQLFRAAHPLIPNFGNVMLSSQKVSVIEGISGNFTFLYELYLSVNVVLMLY